jgi:hypothetical protein
MTANAQINIPLQIRITSLLMLIVLLMWGCGAGGGGSAAASGLTWNPPTTYANSNGTPLHIKGYRVFYRTDVGYYSSYYSYFVPSPNTSLSIQSLNLSPGKYYFVVTAVDIQDMQSDFSNEVSIQVT